MTFAYSGIDTVFNTDTDKINCIAIENRKFYADIVSDISGQIAGSDGKAVMSFKKAVVDFSKYADILTSFFPFDLNRKTILTKIASELENRAQSAEHYIQTSELLSDIEKYLNDLASDFSFDLAYKKLSASSLIKSVGIEIVDDSISLAGEVLNYMSLVREFDGNKLFFTVNLRSFIEDDEMNELMKCMVMHRFDVIMLENCSYPVCEYEKRFTVDSDLCCF